MRANPRWLTEWQWRREKGAIASVGKFGRYRGQ